MHFAPETMCVMSFSVAAGLGALGTWSVRRLAFRWGMVSKPNPIVPQHTTPVAYLGGVGIAFGLTPVAAGMILTSDQPIIVRAASMPYLLPAALFLVLGVADDLRQYSASAKFAFQTVIAVVAVMMGVDYPFTGGAFIDGAISVVCILVLVNAFNLTDVCDGLLGGLSVVVFLVIAWLDASLAPFALAAAGACAGFLVFNFPPASIFMGDAGSHFLGFLAAAMILSGGRSAPGWPYLGVACLILAVPLFELAFLIAVRTRKGLPWYRGSPDHFSLRLQAAGLSRRQTVAVAWTAGAMFAGGARVMPVVSSTGQLAIVSGATVLLGVFAVMLLRWEVTAS